MAASGNLEDAGSGARLPGGDEIVRGATLTEQVYDMLRLGLLHGAYKPGEKITARSLGRSLGISLTPARDALARLATEGAIEVSETRAFVVPLLNRARYAEISRIRLALEPMAAELACAQVSDPLIARLETLTERMRERIGQQAFEEALGLDSTFHLELYEAAGSPVLSRLIDGLWLQVGPTRHMLPLEYRANLGGYNNHLGILKALRARDPEASAEAVRKDLSDGQAVTVEALQS